MSRIRWNTQSVARAMEKEGCTLIDEYKRGDIRIQYTYEGKEYSVRWNDWVNSTKHSRPHLTGGNRITKPHEKWNNEKVIKLLQKDGCELADEYKSTKQRLRYKYNDHYYWTTIDDWIHHNSRPLLYVIEGEQRFRKYLEDRNIDFVTQKSYDDLKTKNNYKMRFDFYLPEYELLVEIDDRGHTGMKNTVENGKLKDQYCIEHKLKLLRIDETVTEDEEFDKALKNTLENDIYIMKYGRLYKFT